MVAYLTIMALAILALADTALAAININNK